MLLLILLYALFGSSFPMGKVLLNYTSPIFLAGARFLPAGLILLSYQYFHPSEKFKFKRKHMWYYIQIIFFWCLFYLLATFLGPQLFTSIKNCILIQLISLFIFFLFLFIFQRNNDKKTMVWTVRWFYWSTPYDY